MDKLYGQGEKHSYHRKAPREPREPKEYGFNAEEQVAVKIRGMPYQTRYEEVADFFKGHNYIEQSCVLGLNQEGRKNGFGAMLFKTEADAAEACTAMNKQYIGSRYVDLSVISYDDYKNFNNLGGSKFGGQPGKYVKLVNFVNADNQSRSLVMRGLPYKATVELIQDFFFSITKLAEDQIFIEEFNGKRTGAALVQFETEEIAQDCKTTLHKKEIEGRYIELFDEHDEFMQKVCRLN